MNQIVSLNTASTLTMFSIEIPGLNKKAHKYVLADIRSMLTSLDNAAAEFSATAQYAGPNNYKRSAAVFLLPKRETYILVSGYSVELRARIVDRWMGLEQQQVTPITATEVATMMVWSGSLAVGRTAHCP
jgi:hypothetical protein